MFEIGDVFVIKNANWNDSKMRIERIIPNFYGEDGYELKSIRQGSYGGCIRANEKALIEYYNKAN